MMTTTPEKLQLKGEYYNACHSVFRSQTNQQDLMLEVLLTAIKKKRRKLHVLSVGSGKGIFDVPLIERLAGDGKLSGFTGLDINFVANQTFRLAIADRIGDVEFQIHDQSFEEFEIADSFDLILFNHVFEYINGGHNLWLSKALNLLKPDGWITVFSPINDEINYYYAKFQEEIFGHRPFFAGDLKDLLEQREEIVWEKTRINGICRLNKLAVPRLNDDGLAFLSFLCQIDVRLLSGDEIQELREYFLKKGEELGIAHPCDFFLIRKAN